MQVLLGGAPWRIRPPSNDTQNINRAVKRATEKDAGDFAESTFEAYGHGGTSMIVNVLSDNSNGNIVIPATDVDEYALLMAAIDNNVSDVELVKANEEGTSVVYNYPKETGAMFEALASMGLSDGAKMGLCYVTKAPVVCSDEDVERNMAIIDALEELDDVDSVEHNMSN